VVFEITGIGQNILQNLVRREYLARLIAINKLSHYSVLDKRNVG
jgi:hypothetical protein